MLSDDLLIPIFSYIKDRNDQRNILFVCQHFFKKGNSIFENNIFSHQSLINAIQKNSLETVIRLIEDSRVDPSAIDNYAIKMASEKGYL